MNKILIVFICIFLCGCSEKLSIDEYTNLEKFKVFEKATLEFDQATTDLGNKYEDKESVEYCNDINEVLKVYKDKCKVLSDVNLYYLSDEAKEVHNIYLDFSANQIKRQELFLEAMAYKRAGNDKWSEYVDKSNECLKEIEKFYEQRDRLLYRYYHHQMNHN